MGMCFFFGGLNREQQFFNKTVAQTAASLLALAVGSLIIPTAYTWQGNFDARAELRRIEELHVVLWVRIRTVQDYRNG